MDIPAHGKREKGLLFAALFCLLDLGLTGWAVSVSNSLTILSDFFKETFFAKRPESEQLENLKLALLGINTMRHWKVSLEEYLPQLVKELSG